MPDTFKTGMVFCEEVHLTPQLVEAFAVFSGDHNPLHLKEDTALTYGFPHPVAHGAIQTAVVSKLIGMKVPGPGAVWMSQSMEWLKPAYVGETLLVEAEIESVSAGAETLGLLLRATNEKGERVMNGAARVKRAARVGGGSDADSAAHVPRVALVTGGSRGIGASIARALGAAGFQVAVACHRGMKEAELLAEQIRAESGSATTHATDLSVEGSGAALASEVLRRHGRLDVLVHAATPPLPTTGLVETPLEELRACTRVHVEAALELVQAAAPGMMQRRHGRIIFLGSSHLFGTPQGKHGAYVAAKSMLAGMMRVLAAELGPHQITANMISPGLTITDLTANVPLRMKEVEARRVPLRRLAVPEDVARLAVFLAGDGGAYVSGQNLPLTGGPV
ncbi:SDR family oxidoreductase [Prosthecobacter sp.]|uniref:SDR family oxidoreductase n=1 Tax=Prosthecobacter sp. TaxID=1965333 RepID=UPI0037845887